MLAELLAAVFRARTASQIDEFTQPNPMVARVNHRYESTEAFGRRSGRSCRKRSVPSTGPRELQHFSAWQAVKRVGAGRVSRGGSIYKGDAGNDGKAGGQSVATGGAGGDEAALGSGGVGNTGGAPISPGSAGEAGAGASGQTECKAGYTVLCGDLYGSTSCAKKRLYCLSDGSWPAESTGCVPSNRDCASLDDNDCDGKADNTIDETCTCTDLGVPVAGQTVCLKYSPDANLSNLCCQCDSKNGVFVLAKKSNTTYTCVVE
jgi:hypothetical protein